MCAGQVRAARGLKSCLEPSCKLQAEKRPGALLQAPLLIAMAGVGLRVGPMIDILHAPTLWDLRHLRVLEWCFWLLEHDRVWYIHACAPCTS